MRVVLRLGFFTSLLAALIASAALPAASHAAGTAVGVRAVNVSWSPTTTEIAVPHNGRDNVTLVNASFASSATLHNASLVLHTTGGPYTVPRSISLGTVVGHVQHTVHFVVVVPAWVKPGTYQGTAHLMARETANISDLTGPDFGFTIHVIPAPVPTKVIHWTPSNLGILVVQRGQTLTQSVAFTSDATLTNASVGFTLADVAAVHGVALDLGSSSLPVTVAAGTPVTVPFSIRVASNARLGTYRAHLHIKASINGGPAMWLQNDIYFYITVTVPAPVPAQANWFGLSPNPVRVLPGQTVTATASFTTNQPLTNAVILAKLGPQMLADGLSIRLISVAASPAVAANTTVQVTFQVSATAAARATAGAGSLSLEAQNSVGLQAPVPGVLRFTVQVM